jgi:hypothetical protein
MATKTNRRISQRRINRSKRTIKVNLDRLSRKSQERSKLQQSLEKLGEDSSTMYQKRHLDNELSVLDSSMVQIQSRVDEEQNKLNQYLDKNNSIAQIFGESKGSK